MNLNEPIGLVPFGTRLVDRYLLRNRPAEWLARSRSRLSAFGHFRRHALEISERTDARSHGNSQRADRRSELPRPLSCCFYAVPRWESAVAGIVGRRVDARKQISILEVL